MSQHISKQNPPIAPALPHTHTIHSDQRIDPYFWLKDRNDPAVKAYLDAENAYAESWLKHTEPLRKNLVKEMYSRIVETDTSVPVKRGPFEYYFKDEQQSDYLSHHRRKIGDPESEELVIDENVLAKGRKYFDLGNLEVSPDHQLAAFATDFRGDEIYTIEVLRLKNRKLLPDKLNNTSGNFVWTQSNSALIYTTLNEVHRPHRVYRHRLGESQESDELIFEELDDAYYVSVSESDSERFIQINLKSAITSEVYLLDAKDDQCHPRLVFERTHDVLYRVQDRGDALYVLTNDNAVNFRLIRTKLDRLDRSDWIDVIPHQDQVTLTGFKVFSEFIVVEERRNGLPTIRVLQDDTSEGYTVQNPEKIQELRLHRNWEFDTTICRVGGNSLDLPYSVYDLEMTTGVTTHLKTQPIGGDFDPKDYSTEKHLAISHDGTEIPIYLVYSKKALNGQPAPLLLNGYGAYGINSSLYFSSKRLSLLNRGIIFAITQIRGGSEMGRGWYLDGKLDRKKNTFHDFNACANYLINEGITSQDQLAIIGGSAGGLVVGNFLNSDSVRCKAALAMVPFVDIVTTILDDTLPLSVVERDEWGDPNDPEYYDYMKSYSPYDNTQRKDYPALYITAGLNDPRVGYWEPAKWAAKIRQCKTDNNPLLLITEMDSGHSGASGRLDSLHETARDYAFIITQLLSESDSQ